MVYYLNPDYNHSRNLTLGLLLTPVLSLCSASNLLLSFAVTFDLAYLLLLGCYAVKITTINSTVK